MDDKILDRRIRKTRKALRECLIQLMRTKRLQDITVREISEMADINRGTFYLHYKDVYDLAEKIEDDFAEEFDRILEQHSALELSEKPSLLFNELYPFIKRNSDLISVMIGENGNINFENRMKDIIRDRALRKWLSDRYSADYTANGILKAFSSYIVSGCIGLVEYWIKNGMQETPSEMSSLTEEFITKGIRVLQNPGDR
ncbi:MAG: TetR/AcrR family transcriptional regulator [[Clostridium] aminophilum]|uniref:TetR/AcrR family transcriptional regulator n=1 Tax=[Clostridium] aminophilum TaxID=1526 RepID=UPI0026EF80D5|nr:TetR/AcrR family transcriptional regulator [[Clostridium] aminophilum]MDD6195659.1 TetR/AcrR family transcriptional regulator [[Clostridium] aminophilum]